MIPDFEPVTIRAKAAEEIKKIMKTKSIPEGYGLRIGVRGAGCGVSLIIGFDKQKETDKAYDIQGITVYVDKRHAMFIIGKEVDFHESADARGFFFN
jgi:iron-sulfur cluster assembly protein